MQPGDCDQKNIIKILIDKYISTGNFKSESEYHVWLLMVWFKITQGCIWCQWNKLWGGYLPPENQAHH